MTIATADKKLNNKSFTEVYKQYGRTYPDAGYGRQFYYWLMSNGCDPCFSFGNGAAMRINSIGIAFNSLEEVLKEAKLCNEVTHNHLDGIRGAQVVLSFIFMARTGNSKDIQKNFIENSFGYNLNRTVEEIRLRYNLEPSCQGFVSEAIIAFLELEDFEDAIRAAIFLGGDSVTIACITGGIAQAFYKNIPQKLIIKVLSYLPKEFISLIYLFSNKFGVKL
ncbi:MAG: ADP-ribosylglycohydrolase family protein [Bacteroidota bacterium]|nr:ADP-ribosylglycohydrolase family protein [Bacteroidota bacterium]MDP4197096.1 ADP-ribosylglycohydrolase family protein [Bacteroidota bacterium]